MHRVVIFSNSVISNGEEIYGRLYGGNTEREILIEAKIDYKTLLIREQWEGERGEAFREQEGWTLAHSTDGSTAWWAFDKDRYTFNKGYDPIPDQFVQECNLPTRSLAILNTWVLLKFADTNDEDYVINKMFYESVIGGNPNDLQWMSLEPEDDDLPF